MSDDYLTRFRKAPRPEFQAALYQRISTPMITQPKFKAVRTLAYSMAGMAAVLTTIFLVSPPARAFAEDIWRQVGGFIFVQGDPDCPEAKPGEPCPDIEKQQDKKAEAADSGETHVVREGGSRVPDATAPDAAGASALIGFTVLTPGYIPEGFSPEGPWGIVDMGHGTIEARFAYVNGEGERLVIGEAKYDPSQPPDTIVRPEVSDATVNGISAVWLPGIKATLMWEDNGVIFSVTSVQNTIPKSELLKVAESLGQ